MRNLFELQPTTYQKLAKGTAKLSKSSMIGQTCRQASEDLKYKFFQHSQHKIISWRKHAIVVDQGPSNFRKYTVANDVPKSSGTMAAANHLIQRALLNSTANAYLVFNKDVKAISSL
jgi:hypothetical protein